MSDKAALATKEIALIDILDTILDKGAAIRGDLVISIAGIDLVYLDLRLLIASVESLVHKGTGEGCSETQTTGSGEGGMD